MTRPAATDLRLAVVHEWLTAYAGSEKVVAATLELYPDAPVYTLAHDPAPFRHTPFARHPIHTSFIQRLPGGRRHHRLYLPLFPLAVEQFDLRGFDVVFSSNHAVAKGVLTRAGQFHVSYVHTPVRYAWDVYFDYVRGSGARFGPRSLLARLALHYLRLWDVASANRVDLFLASSRYVAERIRRTYRRAARVVHPPVDVTRFQADRPREEFYLTVGRLVPYKRTDLIVEAFRELALPLVVIGTGPETARLRRLAGPHTRLLGEQSDAVVADHMARCRAFVFAADEDFGIAPVEAQAAGAPVLAYGAGGALETVLHGQTGWLFGEQSVAALAAAVRAERARAEPLAPAACRRQAERFAKPLFQNRIRAILEEGREQLRRRGLPPAPP